MVFWGVEVKPGEQFTPDDGEYEGSRLHLSQATLGLDGKGKARTVVKCKVADGPELLLCSLTPGVSESCSLDLLFDQDVVFSVAGSTSVHLVGYYMPLDDEEEDNDYEFDGSEFDSDEVSEDDDFEDDGDMDDMEAADALPSSVTITELDEDGNIATAEVAMLKIKAAAVDSDDEDPKSAKKRKRAGAAKEKKKESVMRLLDNMTVDKVTVEAESEDEDGFPLSSELTKAVNGVEGISTMSSESKKQKKKKAKKESGSEQSEGELKTPGKAEKTPGKTEKTPAKAAKTPGKAEKTPGKAEKTPVKAEKTPNKAGKENGSEAIALPKTPAALNGGPAAVATPASAKTSKKAGATTRKFPNGLEIEEVAMGKPDARQTKPGKKITVHYTGKLKSNGKIFDSSVGKKPFAFRLGVGEVVKGWDVGIPGMRIGDKRKITIPPAMGYGSKGSGPIPGNAWLVFDVELVDVAK